MQSVLQKLQAPIWYGADGLYRAAAYWTFRSQSKDELARRLVELSREIACGKFLGQVEKGTRALEEGNPAAAPSGELENFHIRHARVLRRDLKAWWQELVLSRRAGERWEENMAIVCGDNLVGRTLAIFPGHCVALLATDSRFRIVAHADHDLRPIVYEGTAQNGFGHPVGRVNHVPLDLRATEDHPITVITSSLSGTYPDGVIIGTVEALVPSADGVFQEGTVRLSPFLAGIREVAVLVPKNSEADPDVR